MKNKKYYIGIAATFHDPSIAILDGSGEIVFAESTERHLQKKRAMGCAADSILWIDEIIKEYCDPNAAFHIATTWSKSYTRMLRNLSTFGVLNKKPDGWVNYLFKKMVKSMLPDDNLMWFLRNQTASLTQSGANLERYIRWELKNKQVKRYQFNHHLSHAASGIYGSDMDEATCVVIDGIGEMGSISYFSYSKDQIKQLGHHKGFESLGFFYTLITYLCGFDPIKGEEWKVMGMAPYGKKETVFYELLDSILVIKGCHIKFKDNPKKVEQVLEKIRIMLSSTDHPIQLRADLAYTGQFLFTQYTNQVLHNIHKKGTSDNLIYVGGCALNSSFNGQITANTPFNNVYVPSAPGDDGTSIGAAYMAYRKDLPSRTLLKKNIVSPYLGTSIKDEEIHEFIKFSGYPLVTHMQNGICEEVAQLLAQGALVGWAQGRAEFGPRALGNRSILADPRSPKMKDEINIRVKFREEFRPFAPSVLEEHAPSYFEDYQESPYMERTLVFKEELRHNIPAVVHKNNTGRLQTVKKSLNPKYYELITAFYEITGVPILLNTSFNVMGKPIIHSFKDALTVFFNSGLDVLVVNDYIFKKSATQKKQEIIREHTAHSQI